MDQNNQNSIFAYAFSGVLLLIASVGVAIANVESIMALQMPFIVAVSSLGASAFALLYAAIKMDEYRVKDM